jgi:hypothetical protein
MSCQLTVGDNLNYWPLLLEDQMIDEMIERGAIIGDIEGGSWRVLEVRDEGLFMLMLPERKDVIHTRTVTWRQFAQFGYQVKFP